MKGRKKLRTYLSVVLIIFICMGLFFDDIKDFFVGFFAGWNDATVEYAREHYTALSFICSCASILLLSVVGIILYRKIKRKVTFPIERLANGMQEVSRGNLSVRIPADSDFEMYQMEEAFNIMTSELETAKKEADEQTEREKLLYAGIAHDLKTPMTMIIGYAKLLQNKRDITEEERNNYLDTITEQTSHANELLEAMLSYSKLNNNSYQLSCKNGDIAELLRTSVADHYSDFEKMNMAIDMRIPTENVELCLDTVEMKRVFHNLLNNMVKHNSENTSCIIELIKKSTTVEIAFADNGAKISEELQDKLFDAFAVGDKSRNTKNGSGLGLSVCKKIIERHDGDLCYKDEWKNGYKAFVIEIPIVT